MLTRQLRSGRPALGRVLATPGVLLALEKAGQQPQEFLDQHASCDWAEVDSHDAKETEISLQRGFRILSSYTTSAGDWLWVITEADRSATTLLLPEEYSPSTAPNTREETDRPPGLRETLGRV